MPTKTPKTPATSTQAKTKSAKTSTTATADKTKTAKAPAKSAETQAKQTETPAKSSETKTKKVPAAATKAAETPKVEKPLRFLCVAGMVSGRPFMKQAAAMGHKVIVLTSEKGLKQEWPRDILEEIIAVKNFNDEEEVKNTIAWISQRRKIDRIVPMGDWEVEMSCFLREHMRVPGMGETTMRYFRDKLAMRMKAQEDGVPVPEFVHILNHDDVHEYMQRVPAPWVIKPRLAAASMGVRVMHNDQEVWQKIMELGDKQSGYLLEKYTPGDVFHVDSVVSEREVLFASVSQYGTPMLDLNVKGGVFTTRLIDRKSPDWKALQKLNREVVASMGLVRGVTHIEYIKDRETGKFFFLEAAARVGAAKIPDVAYAATDICLWFEWAKIETFGSEYKLAPFHEGYAGGIMCLANQQWPDLSSFDAPEVVWRQKKEWHAGIIVKSDDPKRIEQLVNEYARRFATELMAHAPAKEHQDATL